VANDYAALQARVADELNRADLTSQIALEILTAIKHYERDRFWFNEGEATASTVAGQINIAVPTDLLEIDSLEVTYASHPYPVTRRDWGWYTRISGRDTNIGKAVPTSYVYHANSLYLHPVPDAIYTLTMSYLKQLTALSAGADSNEWTIGGEELIRVRARQAVRINYLSDVAAKQEATGFATAGEGFLSGQERIAYFSLLKTAYSRESTGRLVATRF
jgi:hypothetical protein